MNRNIHQILLMFVFSTLALSLTSAVAAVASAAPESADTSAMRLLLSVEAKLTGLKSVNASITSIFDYPPTAAEQREMRVYSTYRLMRPNYFRYDSYSQDRSKIGQWTNDGDALIFADDGKKNWSWCAVYNSYCVDSDDPAGKCAEVLNPALAGFFDPARSLAGAIRIISLDGSLSSLKDDGVRVWNGTPYHVVSLSEIDMDDADSDTAKTAPGHEASMVVKIYIGPDALIRRIVTLDNSGYRTEDIVHYFSVNQPASRASFAFTLPAGARLPDQVPSVTSKF